MDEQYKAGRIQLGRTDTQRMGRRWRSVDEYEWRRRQMGVYSTVRFWEWLVSRRRWTVWLGFFGSEQVG